MAVESRLNHKLGPLKLWQWLLIGGGLGGVIYIYEKNKSTSEEISPAEENALLNALGGGAGSGGANIEAPKPAEIKSAEVGVPGTPGTQGEPGAPGATGATPAESIEHEVSELNSKVKTLEQYHGAPQAKASTNLTHTNTERGNPRKGQKYRIVKNSKGQTVHEYADGRKVVVPGSRTTREKSKSNADHAAKQGKSRATKRQAPKRVAPVHHAKAIPVRQRLNFTESHPVAYPAPAPSHKSPAKHPASKRRRR